jgi:hypothetical protein
MDGKIEGRTMVSNCLVETMPRDNEKNNVDVQKNVE